MATPLWQELGWSDIPEEYHRRVQWLREFRKAFAEYEPPSAGKGSDVERLLRRGQYTKVPPELRLVAEESNPFAFLREAKLVAFPRQREMQLSSVLHEVAFRLARLRGNLAEHRERWLAQYKEQAPSLATLDEAIRQLASKELRGEAPFAYNLATMAADLEAVQWPDAKFPLELFRGVPCVGDGYVDKECLESSGLFRPIGRNARYSLAELRAGLARKRFHQWVNGERHVVVGDAYPSSTEWLGQCTSATERDATRALHRAGVDGDAIQRAMQAAEMDKGAAVDALVASVEDEAARRSLMRLIACERMSHAESISVRRGKAKGGGTHWATMTKPLTVGGYRAWAKERGGVGAGRVCRRHALDRGLKPDGSIKVRCIDNLRDNGVNDTVTIPEGVDLPSFLWMIWMAGLLLREWWEVHGRFVGVTCGLDDQRAAYRSIPARPDPYVLWVMYYSFRLAQAVVQRAYGLLFGARAANNQYSRLPRALCHAVAAYFLVPAAHYVDDILNTDLASGEQTAQASIRTVLQSWGTDVELDKRKPNAKANGVLGGRVDLTRTGSHGTAHAEPDATKVEDVLTMLDCCRENGICTVSDAEFVVGKTRWMTGQHYMHVGAAALQPFHQRSLGGDENNDWTESMSESLSFLRIVFGDEFKPRIEVDLLRREEDNTDGGVVLLFTDCAEETEIVDGVEERVDRVSFFVYEPRDGSYHSGHGVIPLEFRRQYFKQRKTYIGVGEECAAVGAFFSAPHLFVNRRVIHFVDNCGSLSHLVNGYAGQPDSARIVNVFHVAVMALRMRWWGEWIPSAANIADIMTRPERFAELRAGLEKGAVIHKYEFKMPPIDYNSTDLVAWMRLMRAAGEESARGSR